MDKDNEKLMELLQLVYTLIDDLEEFGSESCDDYRRMADEIVTRDEEEEIYPEEIED